MGGSNRDSTGSASKLKAAAIHTKRRADADALRIAKATTQAAANTTVARAA